jgi:hypothetical protein
MPEWVLICSKCHKSFSHSLIAPRDKSYRFDPLWPEKPEFPKGGLELNCPHCGQTATYQRFELMFRGVRLSY